MYYNWEDKTNTEELKVVCNLIRNGELVIFPTETVYGIGANALDEVAVGKIFLAKGRPSDNPLIVHLADRRKIEDIAQNITEMEQILIDEFMPGPFTIILERKPIVPDIVTAGLDTVAVRIPENIIAKGIIQFSGCPIAAPSANISGKPSGTKIEDIRETAIGLESTVVKVVDEVPVILRPGAVTPEMIEKVAGKVRIDRNVFAKPEVGQIVESPGMKYRHYSPDSNCMLIYCEDDLDQVFYLKKFIKEYQGNIVVIGFDEHKEKLLVDDDRFISMGNKNDLDYYAKNIYSALRQADKIKPKMILIEGVKKQGIGYAIMNRLVRTCENNVFEK